MLSRKTKRESVLQIILKKKREGAGNKHMVYQRPWSSLIEEKWILSQEHKISKEALIVLCRSDYWNLLCTNKRGGFNSLKSVINKLVTACGMVQVCDVEGIHWLTQLKNWQGSSGFRYSRIAQVNHVINNWFFSVSHLCFPVPWLHSQADSDLRMARRLRKGPGLHPHNSKSSINNNECFPLKKKIELCISARFGQEETVF